MNSMKGKPMIRNGDDSTDDGNESPEVEEPNCIRRLLHSCPETATETIDSDMLSDYDDY